MRPLSFVLVGSGWRAMFYVRIARRYPQCFTLRHLLCRTPEKAARLSRECGVDATADEEVCRRAEPDFVVVAVDKAHQYAVTRRWLEWGFPVLAETPAGKSEAELAALWALRQAGARVQIAEQYIRYPLIAAGLRAVERGALGEPDAAALSLAHDYHAASLLRHMLCLGDTFSPMTLRGEGYTFPVEETDSRYGPVADGTVKPRRRARLTLQFSGGKVGFYDFDSVQYHSFIRVRHINVRGVRGEWDDTVIRCVDAAHRPQRLELRPFLDPAYEVLHTPELLEQSRHWHSEVRMEPWQDEYALATLMLDMEGLISEGREGYPLAQALEDAYTWLLMERALDRPGQAVSSTPQPWHTKGGAL